jgi:STE24 endopeptidase
MATLVLLVALAFADPAAGRDDPVDVPEPSPLALQYSRGNTALWVVSQGWRLLVPALWLVTGASSRLRTLAWRLGRRWWFAVAIYGALFVFFDALIDLPLTYYLGFVRPHTYGLSHQPFPDWLGDATKRLAVGMGMAAALLWLPYGMLAWSPRWWWLWTGLAAVPLSLAIALVVPVWYDPMFNDFGPMKDKALEAKILALAHRAGIDEGRVFEVDKSRETTTVNAYVTGLLGTKRIVLWDTLLAKLDEREVLTVMGHEMGHYALNHVAIGVALSSSGTLFGLLFIHLAARRLLASKRRQARLGFDSLGDVASLPLLLFLGQVIFLATAPLSFAISRHQEHEADRFALELTRDNHAFGTAMVKLQLDNLSQPRPSLLNKLWRWTHPPIGERVDFGNTYRPWAQGHPGRYDGLFRPSDHPEPDIL